MSTAPEFLNQSGVVIDVRSPAEFEKGHIPGAENLPLFSNKERAVVGTIYKQIGSKEAIAEGMRIVGPKMADLVCRAKAVVGDQVAKIHCWRGGMRSQSVADHLSNLGFRTMTLDGGYKAFRRWVLEQFEHTYHFQVVGGFTGCGKTDWLKEKRGNGEQVLDLEFLAHHRGSVFGGIGFGSQPSNEHFQNAIACKLFEFDSSLPIWVEDESRMIGSCQIPDGVYRQIKKADITIIEKTVEERLQNLARDYGKATDEVLLASIEKIAKRLGGLRYQKVVTAIQEGDRRRAAEIVLQYYDAAYAHSLENRS